MRKEAPSDPIRVATTGLDERAQETLRMAFASAGKGICVLSDDTAAEVNICNMDAPDAQTLWQQYRDHYPQRPTVVIALKDPGLEQSTYVAKPINLGLLISAIKNSRYQVMIKQQAASHGASSHSQKVTYTDIDTAIDAGNTKTVKHPRAGNIAAATSQGETAVAGIKWNELKSKISYYSPEEFLQGKINTTLSLANQKSVAIRLSIMVEGKWKNITIDPTRNKVISEINNDKLEKLCTMPLICIDIKSNQLSRRETEFKAYISDNEQLEESMEQFLWKIALWTSTGRLHKGITPSSPIRLSHWPNLTRLKNTPNSLRIAALLATQPSPPALIAKVLNVPISQVFSFYAASQAIGLTGPTGDINSGNIKERSAHFKVPSRSSHHTLFGRILQRLGSHD